MESRDYEKILDVMPDPGIYVIREEDHGLLYFNKRVKDVSPEVRLGVACHDVWHASCGSCPLLTIRDRAQSQVVSYNALYGGIVDITAVRITWGEDVPAFVVTVMPRKDASSHMYRKILHVDIDHDTCDVLKSEPEGWKPEREAFFGQLELFARSGAIYSEDVERFVAFTRREHLIAAFQSDPKMLTLIYRRQIRGAFRWNLLEIVPDLNSESGNRHVTFCVKDVHDMLRQGLEREISGTQNQELIRRLGERNLNIYAIDLNTGIADPICMDGQMRENFTSLMLMWEEVMRADIKSRLHEEYQDEFESQFSLEALRKDSAQGRDKTELLCQWRKGKDYCYISVTAYFGKEEKGRDYVVLTLQDVDERIRRELAHTKRDMQMAAILKSRFRMWTTVDLDTGVCERTDLTRPDGEENVLKGDYAHFMRKLLSDYVHPEDVEKYWAILSLDHLREKAAAVKEYEEEICQYRMQQDSDLWLEQHVIYLCQNDQVMVNILGRDITREKEQIESRNQVLKDRADIISSLSRLFFSTYYIDLEQDSFRTVMKLRRMEDVLGEDINWTAASQIYANHFIHPDDREEYLKVMNIEHLRQNLRWWEPLIAVEYRKMPEDLKADSADWVRATVMLASNGADDMPSKVVYVAQNITGSRHKREEA